MLMLELPEVSDLDPTFVTISMAAMIMLGIIVCFVGYRIFRFLLVVQGLLAGGLLGAALGSAVSDAQVAVLVGAVTGGLVGAVLFVMFYFVGIFILGATMGGLLAGTATGAPALLIIAAVAGGILALFLQKAVIILGTAVTGADAAVFGIAYFVTGDLPALVRAQTVQPTDTHMSMMLGGLALAAVGALVQFGITGRQPWKPRPQD
jgi:hypothetical protein